MDRYDVWAGELFDFAVSRPEGFTNEQAMDAIEIKRLSDFNRTARRLRITLGEDDQINLVCDPQGSGEKWLYRLVGNLEEAGPWVANRLRDMETRLETQHGVAKSVVTATDGRSVEGRKARLFAKVYSRLREDLEELKYEDTLLQK